MRMRPPLAALLLLLAAPVAAEIRSMPDCTRAIARNPAMAREEAAQWYVFGGGAEARVCEARTLEALGATRSAAEILTMVASDRNNGLPAQTRATLLRDAGRLWLAEGEPALARETLVRVTAIVGPDPDTLAMRAEANGQLGLWQSALEDLTEALAVVPDRADLLTLRAAARRKSDDPAGGLADAEAALAILPVMPEAMFERGACLAVLGRVPEALDVWFKLIELDPDSKMADLARRNIQRLSGN